MTHDKAVKLAVECIDAEIKTLAWTANMCDMAGATHIKSAVKASQRRKELRAAIEALRAPWQVEMKL